MKTLIPFLAFFFIPELHHKTDVKISILQLLALLGGIAIMFGLAAAF